MTAKPIATALQIWMNSEKKLERLPRRKKLDQLPFCEGFVQRVRNYTAMSNHLLRGSESITDLVSILDELLGNVHELLEFFRHGGFGGNVKRSQRVPYRLLFPRIHSLPEVTRLVQVSYSLNWLH